jgi:oligopeptide transport system permease protein
MSAAANTVAGAGSARSQGVWRAAWLRYRRDRVGMSCLAIVLAYGVLILAVTAGLVAQDWQAERGLSYAPPHVVGAAAVLAGPAGPASAPAASMPPLTDLRDIDPLAPRYAEWDALAARLQTTDAPRSATLAFGADRLGRDVLDKAIQGSRVSIEVGVLGAVLAAFIGTVLGAFSGFFGARVGDALEWLYNVFTSIPSILLIFAFAAVTGRGVGGVVLILGFTGWTGIYRLVRAEFMKHAVREYVRSAEAIGASVWSRMFRHILPNASHVVLVQLSIHVVSFIKYEVILSYLGLGVSVDQVSWGTMLAEAQSELILGHWWQLVTATVMMAVFVTAFSLMADALRDALDPKLRGAE